MFPSNIQRTVQCMSNNNHQHLSTRFLSIFSTTTSTVDAGPTDFSLKTCMCFIPITIYKVVFVLRNRIVWNVLWNLKAGVTKMSEHSKIYFKHFKTFLLWSICSKLIFERRKKNFRHLVDGTFSFVICSIIKDFISSRIYHTYILIHKYFHDPTHRVVRQSLKAPNLYASLCLELFTMIIRWTIQASNNNSNRTTMLTMENVHVCDFILFFYPF